MEVSNQQLARTITQKDHLKTLEEIIAKSENAFYETGSALREIREQKLYRLKMGVPGRFCFKNLPSPSAHRSISGDVFRLPLLELTFPVKSF